MRQRYGTKGLFWKKKFLWDITMAVFIVLLPISLYAHILFDNSDKTLRIFGFVYEHQLKAGARTFVWLVLVKLIPLSLLIVWFFNTNNWWRYFLLIPTALWIDSLVRNSFIYSEFWENNLLLLTVLVNCAVLLFIFFVDKQLLKGIGHVEFRWYIKKDSFKNVRQVYRAKDFTYHYDTIKKDQSNANMKNFFVYESVLGKEAGELFNAWDKKRPFQKLDILIVLSIITTPFIYYTYKLVPYGLKTYHTQWFNIESYGFPEVNTFVWYIGMKVGMLLPLSVWFITSGHWWRYAILSPIVLTTYQLWEAFQNTSMKIDEIELFQALPLIICIIGLLIFLARIVNYQSKILEFYNAVLDEIEQSLDQFKSSPELQVQQKRFELLKQDGRSGKKAIDNLDALLILKQDLMRKIETKD